MVHLRKAGGTLIATLMATCFLITPVRADSSADIQKEIDGYKEELADTEDEINGLTEDIEMTESVLDDVADALQEQTDIVEECEDKLSLRYTPEREPASDALSDVPEPDADVSSLIDGLDEYKTALPDTQEELEKAEDAVGALSEQEDILQARADDLSNERFNKEVAKTDLEETIEKKEAEYEEAVKKEESSKGSKIVNAAYSQLGVPYVWGGSTPGSALDCSGLVQYCLRKAGVSVAHSSDSIGAGGTAVSSPRAGDIVCYSGHVAVYIGNGQMIEAPHSGAVVRIASVRSGCWYRRY